MNKDNGILINVVESYFNYVATEVESCADTQEIDYVDKERTEQPTCSSMENLNSLNLSDDDFQLDLEN